VTARLSLLLPAALAAAALLPGAGHAGDPVLTADVGLNDAYVIDLKDAGGASVSRLVPGTYTLVVHDHSALHSFHLVGSGVNVATTVAGTGDSTYTITLVAGNYSYHCDAHSYDMHGGFTVSAAATPTLRLAAYVGPGARIGVSWSPGLKPGHAVIVVRDRSAGDNFRLTGPGVVKATGVAFRGTVTWTVTLRAGTYRYRSDRHAGLSGKFTVPR
jgi:plastocyanin